MHWEMPRWGGAAADESSSNNHSCNVSDFSLSDVLIASLPFYESGDVDVFTELSPLPRYIFPEPSVLLDAAEQYMLLPYLDDVKSDEEDKRSNVEKHDLFVAFNQSKSQKLEATEESEDFDPRIFIRNQPELYDVVSSYFPDIMQPKKTVTLVLDLDGMFFLPLIASFVLPTTLTNHMKTDLQKLWSIRQWKQAGIQIFPSESV